MEQMPKMCIRLGVKTGLTICNTMVYKSQGI